jgi:DNA-directed RNA polymerase specialized sigma24 family protein
MKKKIGFKEQLLKLKKKLSLFAIDLTLNSDDAKELVQETLAKATMYEDQLNENVNLKLWLFQMMEDTFPDHRNKKLHHVATFDHAKGLVYMNYRKDFTKNEPDFAYSSPKLWKELNFSENEFMIPYKLQSQDNDIADETVLQLLKLKNHMIITKKRLADA